MENPQSNSSAALASAEHDNTADAAPAASDSFDAWQQRWRRRRHLIMQRLRTLEELLNAEADRQDVDEENGRVLSTDG